MDRSRFREVAREEGQSLVLILVVLVIGAVIAFAIAARTISDLRRVTSERTSSQAGSECDAMLDVFTSNVMITKFITEGGDWAGGSGDYCGAGVLQNSGTICVINDQGVRDIMGDSSVEGDELLCDDAEVQIRKQDDVSGMYVEKDDVVEFNLSDDSSPGFTVSWDGVDASTYPNLLIKVFRDNAGGVELEEYVALRANSDAAYSWGDGVDPSADNTVNASADSLFVRIRPIGGPANLTLKEVGKQEVAFKGSCFQDEVQRECIRRVPMDSYVPACFDYVLFDGSTMIDEFNSPSL